MAWREDNRRVSNGVQYLMIADAALKHPVSKQWCGYWQRSARTVRNSTETYEHTINGLLQKCAELMEEMAAGHERLGVLTNDIEAIDHVLTKLGHTEKLE